VSLLSDIRKSPVLNSGQRLRTASSMAPVHHSNHRVDGGHRGAPVSSVDPSSTTMLCRRQFQTVFFRVSAQRLWTGITTKTVGSNAARRGPVVSSTCDASRVACRNMPSGFTPTHSICTLAGK
jgi:hypothetical protein